MPLTVSGFHPLAGKGLGNYMSERSMPTDGDGFHPLAGKGLGNELVPVPTALVGDVFQVSIPLRGKG